MIKSPYRGHRYPFGIVAFGGQPTFWWMHFLKKDFYHCLVVLGKDGKWVMIDPLCHYTDLIMIEQGDVLSFLHAQGYRTLLVPMHYPQTHGLQLTPYTCVETVKRFLGIDKPFILTPYQLYQYLKKRACG